MVGRTLVNVVGRTSVNIVLENNGQCGRRGLVNVVGRTMVNEVGENIGQYGGREHWSKWWGRKIAQCGGREP